jgi:hypothetical protein
VWQAFDMDTNKYAPAEVTRPVSSSHTILFVRIVACVSKADPKCYVDKIKCVIQLRVEG